MVKRDKNALPSMAEVFKGLYEFIEDLLENKLGDKGQGHGPKWVQKC